MPRRPMSARAVATCNPDPWVPDAERGIAPTRMDHCLLYGPDIEKVQEIFEEGARLLPRRARGHGRRQDGSGDLAVVLDQGA